MILTFCDKSYIVQILLIIKTIFKLCCFLAPIIVIIVTIIHIFKVVMNGKEEDLKEALKVTVKRLIAGLLIAFLPALTNYVFTSLVDTSKVDFLACFESASAEKVKSLKEKEEAEAEAKKKAEEEEDREKLETAYKEEQKQKSLKKAWFEKWKEKNGKSLDFSCNSNVVKSQFSCSTMSIVEKHMYDVNYNNFKNVIASHGGFDNYAKSLGGVFADYYGRELHITTESEFQKVAEYIFGWMYMYGMDYCSGEAYHNWGVGYGGSGHSDDAFYSGNFRAEHCTSDFDQKFDEVISGTGGNSKLIMATECGPAVRAILYKSGILKSGQDQKALVMPDRLQDLRPGDLLRFFDSPQSNTDHARHVAIVGEVYDDRIVIYDGGSHFQTTRNYKRVINRPTNSSEDNTIIKNEFGFGGWKAERFAILEKS